MGAGDESEWPDRRSLTLVKQGHSTNKFSLRHKQGATRGAGDDAAGSEPLPSRRLQSRRGGEEQTKTHTNRDFPGAPAEKIPRFQCRGPGFDP